MANLQQIMQRAQALRKETALDSISPERAGGIMYDTLSYINQMQLQDANPILLSKIYSSVEAMQADTAPVSDITGKALRPGQVVVIVTSSTSSQDYGVVYRYNGIADGASSWTAVGKIGSSPYLEGYLYAGIATPATDPQTANITQRVFYRAVEPGTYTNFGGIVVNSGEVVNLKFDGSSWSKEVTGEASAASVTELGQQVIYDVTANNADAKFASLSALLSSENLSTLIPIAVRCGGMSIRFVKSSDNKYVQYRLMADTFSATENDWQGVDDEPISGSDNLVKSEGVKDAIEQVKINILGETEYSGALNIGALHADGKIYDSHDAWYTTDYIQLKRGEKFISTAYNEAIQTPDFPNACIYSSRNENSFIRGITATVNVGFEYVAEEDCYIRFANTQERWVNPSIHKENSPISNINSRLNETHVFPKLVLYTNTSYGYLTRGGIYNPASAFWVVTDFIHLLPGMCIKSYKPNRNHSADFPNCSVYKTNSQSSFVKDIVADGDGFEYIAKEDCYVRFCNSEEYFELYVSDISETIIHSYEIWISEFYKNINTTNPLKGKKIGFLGDSITDFGQYVNAFAEKTGANVVNYGVSGSRISSYIASGDSFIERAPLMADDLDVVVVFGGVNDQRTPVPLGTFENRNIDGSLNGTFYGALHTLCRELFAKYAGKPIIFMTPMHNSYRDETYGDTGDYNYYEYTNNGQLVENKFPLRDKTYVDDSIAVGDVLSKYRRAIIEVCTFYAIPVIDMYSISGLFPIDAQNSQLYTLDGLHPNNVGGNHMADIIIPKIEEIVKNQLSSTYII